MLKPNRIGTIRTDLSGFAELARIHSEIVVNKSPFFEWTNCSFFDANMSAALAACTEKEFSDKFISHNALKPQVKSILSKNLFLCRYGYEQVKDTHGTTIPFSIILPNGAKKFAEYISCIFDGKGMPRVTNRLKNRINQSLMEIVNNSMTHSDFKNGVYCCGQLYPNEHKLKISLVDNGIGIRRRIYSSLGMKMNSDKAIEWALERGNTTKKGTPGGLGLDFLKEFVRLNKGEIMIVSDRGYWKYSPKITTSGRMEHSFPGTAVNVTINTADDASYKLSSE